MPDALPVQLSLAEARGLHAQRFPKDSYKAASIVFLEIFCLLGKNGSLDSHSVGLYAASTLHTHLYISYSHRLQDICTPTVRDPVLLACGFSTWQRIWSLDSSLSHVLSALGTEQRAVPTPYYRPCAWKGEGASWTSTHQQASGPEEMLRDRKPSCLLAPRLPSSV